LICGHIKQHGTKSLIVLDDPLGDNIQDAYVVGCKVTSSDLTFALGFRPKGTLRVVDSGDSWTRPRSDLRFSVHECGEGICISDGSQLPVVFYGNPDNPVIKT
jgi:hypothetical protein